MAPRQNARAKKLILLRYNKLRRKYDTRMHGCISGLRKRFPILDSLSSMSSLSSWSMSTWSSDFSLECDSLDFSLGVSDDIWGEHLGQDWLEKTGFNEIARDMLEFSGDTLTGLMGGSEDRWARLQRWVHQQIELANKYEEPYDELPGAETLDTYFVTTIPPLPDLKAWFVPRPTGAILAVKTISELKKVLCHDITQLSQRGHSFKTIRLLLEDFELLDDLPYEEVLRDGDLVLIQVFQDVPVKSEHVRKRKRRDTLDGVPTKRRRKNNNKRAGCDVAIKASTSSDSSSAVGSTSTSESDDDSENSDSDSSTTSNNESSSESSDDSTSSNSSRRLSLLPEPISQPKGPVISPVPPGLGKPSTHSRNRRRRLKRQYAKDTKEAPPQGISDANLTPFGSTVSEKPSKGTKSGNGAEPGTKTATEHSKTHTASSESRDDSSPLALDNSNGDIMMMSLRNKNKKKNFRQTMVTPTVRKIVFDDSGNAQSVGTVTPAPAAASSVVSSLHIERTETVQEDQMADTSTSLLSRVLPPSELAAAGLLPSNMFVTSVEFGRQPKKKKKQNLRDTHEEEQVSHELRVSHAYEDEDESRFEDANIDLPYGDEEESGNNNGEPQFDWGMAESNWERFSPVESLDQLRSGVLVCWQSLAINPRTFTPENMLSVGRVEKVATETVTIRQLLRPGTEIAAAFGIGEENGGDGAEEEHSSEDVFGLGWRVVELA